MRYLWGLLAACSLMLFPCLWAASAPLADIVEEPMSGDYPDNWNEIAHAIKEASDWKCERCGHPQDYCLTVHHLDMNKSNCEAYNLAALCQRCHLKMQAKIDMQHCYMYEHADWLKKHLPTARQMGDQ